MSFQWPLALLSLLLIPIAISLYILYRRRVARSAVPFPDVDVLVAAQHRPRLRRYLPLALAGLSLAAFLFALGRPNITRGVPREQATIVLAIDVSGSMAAEDVEPNRLDAAQDAAKAFAERVPRQYRIGLVSFAGVATLQVPPTTDRVAFNSAVDNLNPQGATAIGEAIFTSLDAIRATQPTAATELKAARILLLSDGSTTTGRTNEEAAAAAREAKVPVATVALGTPDGVLLNGTAVPPSPGALRALAEATGAQSYETRDAESLSAVYEKLGSIIGTVDVKDEITGWPAGLGALFLALAGLAAWRFGARLP